MFPTIIGENSYQNERHNPCMSTALSSGWQPKNRDVKRITISSTYQ